MKARAMHDEEPLSSSGSKRSVDSGALKRTLRSMEANADRLEEKKRQLTKIVQAVGNVSAAEKAAISARLPPLCLTQASVDMGSDRDAGNSDGPPPSYESLIKPHLLDSLTMFNEKQIVPDGDLVVFSVSTEQDVNPEDVGACKEAAKQSCPSVLQKISALLNSDKGLNGTFGALNPEDTNVEEVEEIEYEFQTYGVKLANC